VAISTGGQSPAAAAYVKQQLQQKLPGYYGDMIETLGNYRNMILEQIDTADKRKQVFNSLLKYGDSHGGHIPESVVLEEIERQKN
jgi:siroheme synthase (precorrin-2 oxidase/ferrochelatase)